MNLQGKTAVVTGGSNGIGLACARRFAGAGAQVFVLDQEPPTQTEGLSFVRTDVTHLEQLEQGLQHAGAVEVAAINAGMVRPAKLLSTTDEDWNQTLQLNLTAAFRTLRAVAAGMKAGGRGGSIVVTASTNSFDGEGDLTAYNASKAGLLGLVRTAANELGIYGIRVNAVCPGLIRTRLTQGHFDNPHLLRDYFRHIPLGRGGEPDEVGAAVLFLASDDASFITGTTLVVDGGQMASKFGPWSEDIADFEDGRWRLR
ncbi:MAG TPA: SDR family NAD(P)-dependent oxidoreductase [Bryobacteraceae bacterium]|nr:SDR family NAD(P)-dependent oxidoreductase [Bryobacteraceae bacterium]